MTAGDSARKPRLAPLTSLRFFAALALVLYHYGGHIGLPGPVDHFFRYGYAGVSLFFVLSGFVLAYNYAELNGSAECRRFRIARFARIYPAYLLALMASVPVFAELQESGIASVLGSRRFFLEASMLQAWSPYDACGINCPGWSLSVEAFFYLLFPLIVSRLRHLSDQGLIAVFSNSWMAAVLVPAAYLGIFQHAEIFDGSNPLLLSTALYLPLFHLPQFVIGAATGLWFLRHGRQRSRAIEISAAAAGMLVACLLSTTEFDHLVVNNGLFAPAFAAIIYALAQASTAGEPSRAGRLLELLGESSYGMYIFQQPLAAWFSRLVDGSWIPRFKDGSTLGLYLLVLVAASVASFYWLETPLRQKVMRRSSSWKVNQPVFPGGSKC